jgi:hypothetical protein
MCLACLNLFEAGCPRPIEQPMAQCIEIDFVFLDLTFPEVRHPCLDNLTEFRDGMVFHVLDDLLVNLVAMIADEVVVLLDQFAEFLVELGCAHGRLSGVVGSLCYARTGLLAFELLLQLDCPLARRNFAIRRCRWSHGWQD